MKYTSKRGHTINHQNGTIRFSVLASGSSGNCCYVETDQANVLIDAGLSAREIERRLGLVGVKAETLNALIVTHEHGDHIRGAGPLCRRYDLPLYINRATFNRGSKILKNISKPVFIETGAMLEINDLILESFTKCHDAVDPIGVVLSANGSKIGIVTDLGKSTGLAENKLRRCQALIMEFNYDPQMLDQGPYPLNLKRRIKSRDGHLSNQQAAELLQAVSHEDLRIVVLAHLSETNNDPDKAFQSASGALKNCGLENIRILTGNQDTPIPMERI